MWLLKYETGKPAFLFHEKEDVLSYMDKNKDHSWIIQYVQVYVKPDVSAKPKERIEPLVPLSRYKED